MRRWLVVLGLIWIVRCYFPMACDHPEQGRTQCAPEPRCRWEVEVYETSIKPKLIGGAAWKIFPCESEGPITHPAGWTSFREIVDGD